MNSPRQQQSNSVEFWKKQAESYEQKANDIQQELDEYTENSAQLEKELEASIEQVEKQNRDLDHQNQRLKSEIDTLRNRLDRSQQENSALENELQVLKVEKDKQLVYIRELEQKNDDLERGQRVITESVSYIEALLSQAYERNAMLENEVDEKETLKIELQRISDEARDLKQELKVKDRLPTSKKEEDEKREVNGNAVTATTRALVIVGDLLRKVGLEKLLCRECGKLKCTCEQPPTVARSSSQLESEPSCFGHNGHLVNQSSEDLETNSIEFRKNRVLTRQHSDIANDLRSETQISSPQMHRRLEQPFSRSGDGGKLRKSFAVRSREGIENLLSFTSIRKSHDPIKQNTSAPIRQ